MLSVIQSTIIKTIRRCRSCIILSGYKKSGLFRPLLKLPSLIFKQPRFPHRFWRTKTDRPKSCRVGRCTFPHRHARGAIPTWTTAASPAWVLNQQASCHDSDSMPEKPFIRIQTAARRGEEKTAPPRETTRERIKKCSIPLTTPILIYNANPLAQYLTEKTVCYI